MPPASTTRTRWPPTRSSTRTSGNTPARAWRPRTPCCATPRGGTNTTSRWASRGRTSAPAFALRPVRWRRRPRRARPSSCCPIPLTGADLKRFRESRGISLRDIATASKVGIRYLEYIEAERMEVLPAPVYLRGFVQEYARVVGLDPRQTAESYARADRGSMRLRLAWLRARLESPARDPGGDRVDAPRLSWTILTPRWPRCDRRPPRAWPGRTSGPSRRPPP